MKILTRNDQTYRLPSQLNHFQEQLYIHLIDWKRAHITEASGMSHGNTYDAILPKEYEDQLPMLYPGIRDTLTAHLQRFPFRIHKYFNHMASSQAANINLFLPVLIHPKAASILNRINPEIDRLATEYLDHGFRIEFWDEPHGRLNDKTPVSGTDSDIAIAYYNQAGALSLWLIEHKLTESEFTQCGGYRSKGKQAHHDCSKSFGQLVSDPSACYYHSAKGFKYWDITAANQGFFSNHGRHAACPFQGGMNQLWRNQLLAMAIEQDDDQPYQKVTFSVVRHPRNNALDQTIADYERLIDSNPKFSTFTSTDVITAAADTCQDLQPWIDWYRHLYDI